MWGYITSGAIGFTLFISALWFWIRKGKPALKLVAWFMLFAGLFIGGSIRGLINTITTAIRNGAGNGGNLLFGVGVPVVMLGLSVIIVLELWHTMIGKGLKGKKGKPNILTPILALLAPALIIAGGSILGNGLAHVANLATGWLN